MEKKEGDPVLTLFYSQDTVESIIVGIDCESHVASIGLVLPVWAEATVTLDGDGGFSIGSAARVNIFKPVSIQVFQSERASERWHRSISMEFSSHSGGPHTLIVLHRAFI